MVRNYKRKKETPYTRENLLKAVEEVKSKRLSSYQAAEKFNVPRATIYAHVTGTRGIKKSTPGRSTVFSKDIELRIANCLGVMEKCGYPLTRKEVLSLISEYIRRNGIVTIFKNDIPGDDWFRSFRRRHNFSLKKPQSVEVARRKACNPFSVYEYFDILEKEIQDLNLTSTPDRIYNLDETSFCLDPTKSKVVGKVGERCTRTTSSPGRTNTTVLLAANANGDKVPPLIVFQGKYLWNEWFYPNEKVKTAYAVSKKGWMECSIFEKYMKDVFVPAIGSKRPVLLIFDGSKTHIDLNIIEFAISEGITILKLPPHSTDVLQPLDCSVMKPMKDRWDEELIKWQRMHVGFKLPKNEFARILTCIWDNLNPIIISNGFKRTGIYPVNRNMINKEKFDPLIWEKWENHVQSLHETNHFNKSTVNDADIKESIDSKSTVCHDLAKDLYPDVSVFPIKNFAQEVPSLRYLSLRIVDLTINQSQHCNSSNDVCSKFTFKDSRTQNIYRTSNPKTFKIPLKTITNNTSSNINSSSIKILQNVVIKPPQIQKNNNESSTILKVFKSYSSEITKKTAKENNFQEDNITLEKLILSHIARNDLPKKPKKRVGAEILTYSDVVARIKKAKEEQETNKMNKNNKQKQQEKKKRNKEKESKTKTTKKKQNQNKAKKNKKWNSDSDSTGSYRSEDSSETEDMDTFFRDIINEAEEENTYKFDEHNECKITEKAGTSKMKTGKSKQENQEKNKKTTQKGKGKENRTKDKKSEVLQKGTYILARFASYKGKKQYKYVCLVEEITFGKIVVQGFKSIKNSKSQFRLVMNDVSIIDHDDVVECLPEPEFNEHNMLYTFPKDINIAEK